MTRMASYEVQRPSRLHQLLSDLLRTSLLCLLVLLLHCHQACLRGHLHRLKEGSPGRDREDISKDKTKAGKHGAMNQTHDDGGMVARIDSEFSS